MFNSNSQNYDYNHNDFEMNLNNSNNKNERPKLSTINEQIRLGFITKVYGILSFQLLITMFFCMLSMASSSFLKFQLTHTYLLYFFLLMTIVLPILLICFESMKKVPNNYIVLGLFTISESYIVGAICGMADPKLVFMAAFMTFALVISLTLYAMTTKTDFTMSGGILFVLGCGLLMFSIFGLFTSNKLFHIILCVAGIVLFGIYLLYDTQLIIGDRGNKLDIDDYVLAAFMLYTDIIYIFLRILELLQLLSNSN